MKLERSKTYTDEKTPTKQKSKDSGARYRPSAPGATRDVESYVPTGVSGSSLTYSPSKIDRRANGAEHAAGYVPTVKEKRIAITRGAEQYVPSKTASSMKATYVPTEINTKSASRTLKISKTATYKPSRKQSPEVNEYVPAGGTSEATSGVSYKPTMKRTNRLGASPDTKAKHDEAYEPSGVTDSKLQYRPSQITTLTSQNTFSPEPPLQLRTVRRKRTEASPEKTDAQKRLRHNKASAPEKCLMSDLMFGWTKENQDRIDKKSYSDKEISLLEAEISRLRSLKSLTESHIRYLFYKLEHEIPLVAVGEPLRQRHVLFMNEQSALLDNAIPITAVSPTQLDLIRKLCMDHFNQEHGFNILYVVRVLLPEVIIRMHMLVHGTSYEESDKQTDIGLVDLNKAQSRRSQNVMDRIQQTK
ncbi:uncharacterized protein LOC100899853 [Galendromus occidentalis]|uniref:Uncharacterized protein LOC100899853 n=1 Tax=Galendromus occidentalis TaxID=34638 RepID=A0AAJ6QVW8_9ACAR|nr:uncharacterized protein LOC100899853 [Galendromus occidentalis]